MRKNMEAGSRPESAKSEKSENLLSSEEAMPEIEKDYEEEIKNSASVSELIINLLQVENFEGQSGEKLAAIAQAAEHFLQSNMDMIIEGVLNTSDDISNQENYIEGSNVEIRNQLGAKVKAINNPELETLLRNLMKREMTAHLHANEKNLTELAIKHAPALPSLFEVVKRFKQIKDGEKIFLRSELGETAAGILKLDGELEKMLGEYRDQKINPDANKVEDLYNQVMAETNNLPGVLNIRNEVFTRLMSKIKDLRSHIYAEKISSESSSSETDHQPGIFGRIAGSFKRWFRR